MQPQVIQHWTQQLGSLSLLTKGLLAPNPEKERVYKKNNCFFRIIEIYFLE